MVNDTFYRQLDQLYASNSQSVEEFLQNMLDTCRREQDLEGMIAVRNELGSLYRGQARYADSMRCFQEALDKMEQLGRRNSIPYLTVRMNRAGTLRLANRAEEAVKDFRQVLSLLSKTPEDVRYLKASTLNNLGLAYQSLSRLEKTEDYAAQSLELIKTLPGIAAETTSSRTNLTALCLRQGRLEDTERWLEPAITYYQSPEGRQDSHFPNAYVALAALRCQQDHMEEALDCYDQSAATTERFFGQNPQYAAALIALALKREDCAARLEEAAALWGRLQGPDSPRAEKARSLLRQLQENMQ